MAPTRQRTVHLLPAVAYAAIAVGLTVFFGAEAAAAGRPELWLEWALIAASAGVLAVTLVRGRLAGLPKPLWFTPLAMLAFVFCIGFAALHAAG